MILYRRSTKYPDIGPSISHDFCVLLVPQRLLVVLWADPGEPTLSCCPKTIGSTFGRRSDSVTQD